MQKLLIRAEGQSAEPPVCSWADCSMRTASRSILAGQKKESSVIATSSHGSSSEDPKCRKTAGGAFQLAGTGPRGSTYHVLASTDLTQPAATWSALTNDTFHGGVFNFNDNQAPTYPQRFYRIVTP